LKEIATLHRDLTDLYLDATAITDAGMNDLGKLNHLTTLSLYNTRITDAGLKEISRLKHLTTLFVNSPHVTDAGLKQFRQSLPNVQITR
jgi:Leucine-rich repeat (LRR) protein